MGETLAMRTNSQELQTSPRVCPGTDGADAGASGEPQCTPVTEGRVVPAAGAPVRCRGAARLAVQGPSSATWTPTFGWRTPCWKIPSAARRGCAPSTRRLTADVGAALARGFPAGRGSETRRRAARAPTWRRPRSGAPGRHMSRARADDRDGRALADCGVLVHSARASWSRRGSSERRRARCAAVRVRAPAAGGRHVAQVGAGRVVGRTDGRRAPGGGRAGPAGARPEPARRLSASWRRRRP
ncbi:uncharacterized protein LOC116945813 isoform X6 [Petromyzon marinus]|uniref:uncharacterized protein LOC116945813 isoform X6 n=1 Tax=Petromyzon marinus TaxID=7757 RepID=UPI003F71C5AF